MRHGFLRLCAVFVLTVGLVPAMTTVAQAQTEADLSITATWVGKGAPRGAVGDTVAYAITVTNLGPDTAAGVGILASTPDQFNPISLTCSDPAFCLSPAAGELPPGATVTATVVDVVCCFPKGESRTTSAGAGVVTGSTDPNLGNNTATVLTRINGPNGFSFS